MKYEVNKNVFKFVSMLLCIALLFCVCSSSVLAEDPLATQTIEEQVSEMLTKDRVLGELLVCFNENISSQDAFEILNKSIDCASNIVPLF